MDQEKHILEQTHSCTHMLNISIKHTHRPHIHTHIWKITAVSFELHYIRAGSPQTPDTHTHTHTYATT